MLGKVGMVKPGLCNAATVGRTNKLENKQTVKIWSKLVPRTLFNGLLFEIIVVNGFIVLTCSTTVELNSFTSYIQLSI